jgi:two-component system response regulator FlrC
MSAGILVVSENETDGRLLCEQLNAGGFRSECVTDTEEALAHLARRDLSLCLSHARHAPSLLPEVRLAAPCFPVVVLDEQENVATAVEVMRGGAADYLSSAVSAEVLLDKVNQHLKEEAAGDVINTSAASRRTFDLAARVARTDVSVLISGESGVGKEVVARFIHEQSDRRRGPFVAINCAAIPENMLEAILFGHVKGAFTGAHQSQPGKFEIASGGTLLLDEISEMPLSLQAKLLRVLQEREVERVGAKAPVAVNVRVLATTNVDIRTAVSEGRFREDLFYRLSVFPLQLAPLRERVEDVEALARHFIAKHTRSGEPAPELSATALVALRAHLWPGNVRELENAVQRALVMRAGNSLQAEDFGLVAQEALQDGLSARLLGAEGEMILAALRANGGQRRKTARELGVSERTLRYKLQRLREQGVEV